MRELFADDRWIFRVEHKDIRVYSASVENSGVLGFKGIVELPVELRKLVALFHDLESYTRWVHQLSSMSMLEKGDGFEYVLQQVINAPWPLQPREMIVRTALEQAGDHAVAVTMTSAADYLPPDPRLSRVEETAGKWVFEPLENGCVRIIFMMYVNPGRDIPTSIANTAMFEVPFYSLQNLRRLALDTSYNPPYPDEAELMLVID